MNTRDMLVMFSFFPADEVLDTWIYASKLEIVPCLLVSNIWSKD